MEPLRHWTDFQFRMPTVPRNSWALSQFVDPDYDSEADLDESLWQIQWDDELSRRMDEELDAYEMERIRSEVEWRREQQKADKLIRANFDAESQVEEEEKSLLSMLEER